MRRHTRVIEAITLGLLLTLVGGPCALEGLCALRLEKVPAVAEKPTVVPFSSFLAEVKVETSGQLEVIGVLTLGKETNGADPLKEPLTFTIGTFSIVIPAGSFKKNANTGQIRFKKVEDCVYWSITLKAVDKNKFEVKAELEVEKRPSAFKPEQVEITIGDDGGRAKAFAKIG